MRYAPLRVLFCVSFLPCFACRGDAPSMVIESAGESTGSIDDAGEESTSDDGESSQGDDSTGADPDDDGDESTGTVQPECPEAHECVPLVPPEWNGPVAFDHAAGEIEPGACLGAYPDEVFAGGGDVIAPPAGCGCDCTVNSASCPNSAVLRTGDSCGVPQQSWALPDAEAVQVGGVVGTYWWYDAEPSVQATATTNELIEPAAFVNLARACAPTDDLPDCEGTPGVCVPDPDPAQDDGVCVWKEGEQECGSDYPQRVLVYRSIEDSRACSTCEASSSGTCGNVWFEGSVFAVPEPTVFGYVMAQDDCEGLSPFHSVNWARYDAASTVTDPQCDPGSSQPQGSAEAADLVTVCCR